MVWYYFAHYRFNRFLCCLLAVVNGLVHMSNRPAGFRNTLIENWLLACIAIIEKASWYGWIKRVLNATIKLWHGCIFEISKKIVCLGDLVGLHILPPLQAMNGEVGFSLSMGVVECAFRLTFCLYFVWLFDFRWFLCLISHFVVARVGATCNRCKGWHVSSAFTIMAIIYISYVKKSEWMTFKSPTSLVVLILWT